MNTTAAAIEARVTAATIRAWCRYGAVAAVKRAGRWIVDAASLAHRIAIGQRRKRSMFTVDYSRSWRTPGQYLAVGPAADLKAAYEAGTQIALSGDYAGDRVYLGITRTTYSDGITNERLGMERQDGDTAAYLIDPTRLADAPRLQALIDRETEETAACDAAVADADDAYLNDYE